MRDVRVDQLQPGDVLNGSGFVVAESPYRSVGLKSHQRVVVGKYPTATYNSKFIWNAATTVRVLDSVS